MNHQNPNKFMYVKQDFFKGLQQGGSKVLINPHFVPVKPVKPHFNKNFLPNQTIHVNPNVLKRPDKVVLNPPKVETKTIVSTATKLIRVTTQTSSIATSAVSMSRLKNHLSVVSQATVHTKYKIIRNSANRDQKKRKSDIKKLYYIKNQFKIDHRSMKNVRRKPFNKSWNMRLTTKNVYVKCNSKLNKTPYVSINGILYRRSSKSLVNVDKEKNKAKKKTQLLTIRGQKYKLDSNHRTLTLVSKDSKPNFKTIYLGGITFRRKNPNVFVKTNTSQKHLILSQAKQKSINTLTNKMRKSNIPCPFYRKFGRCKGKENGSCIRIHNPDQISLCPKFLQGACQNEQCLLSHKISPEKMPTCKFFLDGFCAKDNCPYLHVKVSAKADICKDFLEGFCRKGVECDKRHQYLCPDYEKTGKCMKRRCPYPHGNVVRKYKFSSNIASKLQEIVRSKSQVKNAKPTKTPVVHEAGCEKETNLRYYDDYDQKESQECEVVDLDLSLNYLESRPKVGDLPSFIPLLEPETD